MALLAALLGAIPAGRAAIASDLDDFMQRVLARRDENWKKLQQYILDERERVALLAPGRVRLYGLEREYTWFIKQGYFVRSPVRFDGVAIPDAERQAYEQRWIARERRRETREAQKEGPPAPAETPADIADVLRQTTEPRFVSAAYFLRFKFERGRYALVGREALDGRPVLRVEYYPERLFSDEPDAGGASRRTHPSDHDQRLERQMNKVALVTLWVEPEAHQILQYTFENVGFDFLPGRSLVRLDDVHASMRMAEAFPGVWLPKTIEGRAALTFAKGTYEAHFDVDYFDYRQADVRVQIR